MIAHLTAAAIIHLGVYGGIATVMTVVMAIAIGILTGLAAIIPE